MRAREPGFEGGAGAGDEAVAGAVDGEGAGAVAGAGGGAVLGFHRWNLRRLRFLSLQLRG